MDDLDLLTVAEAAGRLRTEIERSNREVGALGRAGGSPAELTAARQRLAALTEALERHDRR
jgi:hypothetical protein